MPDLPSRMTWCDCDGARVPYEECARCDPPDSDDWYDPPLYADGKLAEMDEAALQIEWGRQCNTHDHGVDNLPMGHPTIEDAADRLKMVEAEQKRRGFKTGPPESWREEG